MTRALTLGLVLLATAANSADLALATRHDELRALDVAPSREASSRKAQWAPSGKFSALHTRAVFRSETETASRPYAREEGRTAAGAGIFLSRDEMEGALNSAPSLHRYAYARVNPLRYVDPDGRAALDPITPATNPLSSCSVHGQCEEAGASATKSVKTLTDVATGPQTSWWTAKTAPAVVQAPTIWMRLQTVGPALVGMGYALRDFGHGISPSGRREAALEEQKHQERMRSAEASIRRGCEQGGNCEGILLPTAEEKQGVVIEDPHAPSAIILPAKPGSPGLPVRDELERPAMVEPETEQDPWELAKRGPKPWPEGPHNETIQKRIKELQKELGKEWEHTGGGEETERVLEIPKGGHKETRRMDITFEHKKTGKEHHEQVGRTDAEGNPVPREKKALDDAERATGKRPKFTPYDQ